LQVYRALAALIVALLTVTAPRGALAGNDDGVLLGNDAALVGGAITAVVSDGSALWYNPAGVAHARSLDTLDVSASAFVLRRYHMAGLLTATDGGKEDASTTEVVSRRLHRPRWRCSNSARESHAADRPGLHLERQAGRALAASRALCPRRRRLYRSRQRAEAGQRHGPGSFLRLERRHPVLECTQARSERAARATHLLYDARSSLRPRQRQFGGAHIDADTADVLDTAVPVKVDELALQVGSALYF
jgi:hypothetical protein